MKQRPLLLGALSLLPMHTWAQTAAAPTTGAYVSDPQFEYVQDQTSEGLKQANMILCFLANTRTDAQVNKGRYVAFIDESKCDTSNRDNASNSSNEGGSQSVEYTRMSLTSTRTSNSSAQIAKGHAAVTMGPADTATTVYIYTNITAAPSSTAPNGEMTMQLAGVADDNNQKVMRGKITATGTALEFSWVAGGGGGFENYRLYVDGNETSGSGAIVFPNKSGTNVTLTFGYNSTHFCRSNGTVERCFLRSKDQAKSTVWRYGVYDGTTGDRYDIGQPGFPVKNDANGEFGFASYWGVWFPTALSNGATIKSADGTTSYTAFKTSGRLIKYTRVQKTLNELAKVPFNFWANADVTGTAVTSGANYEAYWNGTSFTVTNKVNCTPGEGCYKEQITSSNSLSSTQLRTATGGFGVMGWSEALGGQLMIPGTVLQSATPGTENVAYNTQTTVLPSDTVPATLKCARNCPTPALLSTPASGSPYTSGTSMKGGGTQASDVVTYTWDASTYQLKQSGTALTNDLLNTTNPVSPQYAMGGIRTGALVDATGTNWNSGGAMDCATGGLTFCDFKANALTSYYVWENGSNPHNSATFLKKSDSSYVQFSAPQSAAFSVPNDSSVYGEFAGAAMNLQFGGFGNLWGIPGKCFDPATNQPANCGPNTRFVPAFSIPTNTTTSSDGKLTIGSATKWVKFLDRELTFKLDGVVGTSGYTRPAGITLGDTTRLPAALSLASADSEDPSVSTNSTYAGQVSASDFKTTPSVIHGVVQ